MKNSHWKIKRTIGAAFICLLILISPAQADILHVSEHVVGGTGLGNNWQNAKASLTDALSMAQLGDTIRVGQGTYHPDSGQSFIITNQRIVIGGYAGWLPTGVLAPDPDQRNVQVNQTILSGDFDKDDAAFSFVREYLIDDSRTDNAFTVVTVLGVSRDNPGTRLEGFIIEGGNQGTYTGDDATGYRGGGILIDDSAMDVVNCTFRFNATGVPPDPEDPIEDPGVTSDGGGASVRGGQLMISGDPDYTRFINCTFHDNFSARGGGLAVVDGSPTNTATQVKVVNSLFYDNQALVISNLVQVSPDGEGGAIIVIGEKDTPESDDDYDVKIEITNCTIANNNAANTTGGLRVVNVDEDFVTIVQNSVFWGNDENGTHSTSSEITRTGNTTGFPAKISVRYSDVEGGLTAGTHLTTFELIDADPDFADEANNDFRVMSNSPLLDAADPDTELDQLIPDDDFDLDGDNTTEELTPDLELQRRDLDSDNDGFDEVDMGSYEGFFTCCEDVAPDALDHMVNVTDLLVLIAAWGPNPGHPADINDDDEVDESDLIALILAWGRCTGNCGAINSPPVNPAITSTQFPSLLVFDGQYGPVSDNKWGPIPTGKRLAADEFKAVETTSVTRFNWWGFYEKAGANCRDIYGDMFVIKYYDAVTHPITGKLVPGTLIGIFGIGNPSTRMDSGQTVGNGIPL